MELNRYQEDAAKYDKTQGDLAYYTLGICGEAGEVAELVKKDARPEGYRKPLNKKDMLLELGDVLWYVARVAGKLGYTLEDVAMANIVKLHKRYMQDMEDKIA